MDVEIVLLGRVFFPDDVPTELIKASFQEEFGELDPEEGMDRILIQASDLDPNDDREWEVPVHWSLVLEDPATGEVLAQVKSLSPRPEVVADASPLL